jgi:hypothetical protein
MSESRQNQIDISNKGLITTDAEDILRSNPETLARIVATTKMFPGSFAFGHDYHKFKAQGGQIFDREEGRIDPRDPRLSHIETARRKHHEMVTRHLDEIAQKLAVGEIIFDAFTTNKFEYTEEDQLVMEESAQLRLLANLNRDYLLHCANYMPQTPYEEMLREMQKSHFIVGSSACSGAVLTTDAL